VGPADVFVTAIAHCATVAPQRLCTSSRRQAGAHPHGCAPAIRASVGAIVDGALGTGERLGRGAQGNVLVRTIRRYGAFCRERTNSRARERSPFVTRPERMDYRGIVRKDRSVRP
jgi:hypothetical protein